MPTACALPVAVPQQRRARCRSRDRRRDRPGPGARNARSMSLRIFDPSSGGDTRSCRASACSASSRYFVRSSKFSCGRRSRKSFDGPPYCRPHDRQVSADGSPASVPWHAGQRTSASSSRRNHACRSRARVGEQRLEPLRAARPRELAHVRRAPARASRAAERRVVLDPRDPGDQRLRVARLDQQRVLLVPQHLAQRRQVARDDRPPRRHVFEQLQAAT